VRESGRFEEAITSRLHSSPRLGTARRLHGLVTTDYSVVKGPGPPAGAARRAKHFVLGCEDHRGMHLVVEKLTAGGQVLELEFSVRLAKSSWMAVRMLASSHTGPLFALVDGKSGRRSTGYIHRPRDYRPATRLQTAGPRMAPGQDLPPSGDSTTHSLIFRSVNPEVVDRVLGPG
jgi:hypothetical protein